MASRAVVGPGYGLFDVPLLPVASAQEYSQLAFLERNIECECETRRCVCVDAFDLQPAKKKTWAARTAFRIRLYARFWELLR